MLKKHTRTSEEISFDQDIEEEVLWRASHDSISESVVQRAITREDYVKNKYVARFKDGILDLMPEGSVLELRYDLEGVTSANLARLETAAKMLAGHRALLSLATQGPLICRVYPIGEGRLAIQFLWSAPISKLQSRHLARTGVSALKIAHEHKRLSIQLQHNKEKFATSELIGFSMLFSEANGPELGKDV